MPNRLTHETSPYLLQHADNPVDWYPWGEEALRRAPEEDKPILLSIGYSACHWCHVMEHESFEDEATARLMNEHFVCIKVDREERPDLDTLYMQAVQAMTGQGGWPLTVFLAPDGKPFYGGTYFPPEPRHGMPSFRQLLVTVAEAWRQQRDDLMGVASRMADQLRRQAESTAGQGQLHAELLARAYAGLKTQYDLFNGGFGHQPKFPQPMALEFLLRVHYRTRDPEALAMVDRTLEKMARGGIYDQLGGGFHRYSVDASWLVPHFEKMLYDNALLARVYLHAYQITGKPLFRRVADETLAYVLREMATPGGGFCATQDADVEGEEGKYYLWTPDEIVAALGPEEGDLFCRYYDVTPPGNFEGKNILHVPRDLDVVAHLAGVPAARLEEVLARGRATLFAVRERRARPGRDDKVITAWNGLMLRTFAEAARILENERYREVAERNARFLLAHLMSDGRLLHTYKDGQARIDAYLDDHACLADGLLAVYEATFDARWFEEAQRLAWATIDRFWDSERGGFFDVASDSERLVARPKDFFDNATPSGNAVAADVLLRLYALTGEEDYRHRAERTLQLVANFLAEHPTGFGHFLSVLDFFLVGPKEVALVGDPTRADTQQLVRTVYGRFLPNRVVALRMPDDQAAKVIPLLADREPLGDRATAYVCDHFACQPPTSDPQELAEQLG